MKLLPDTHSLIWSLSDPDELSKNARSAILDTENDVQVSVVTFWAISLKYALGRIEIKGLNPEDVPGAAKEPSFEITPLEPGEAASFHRLPRFGHRDPFDRLIIRQAFQKDSFLVSADRQFTEYQKYGLKLLW